MSSSFQKLQNFVTDKINKLEIENSELKNKLLNCEKIKSNGSSVFSSF